MSYPPLEHSEDELQRRADDSENSHKITNFDLYVMINDLKTKTENHIKAQTEIMPKLQELVVILDRGKFLVAVIIFLSMIAAAFWAVIEWVSKHVRI